MISQCSYKCLQNKVQLANVTYAELICNKILKTDFL